MAIVGSSLAAALLFATACSFPVRPENGGLTLSYDQLTVSSPAIVRATYTGPVEGGGLSGTDVEMEVQEVLLHDAEQIGAGGTVLASPEPPDKLTTYGSSQDLTRLDAGQELLLFLQYVEGIDYAPEWEANLALAVSEDGSVAIATPVDGPASYESELAEGLNEVLDGLAEGGATAALVDDSIARAAILETRNLSQKAPPDTDVDVEESPPELDAWRQLPPDERWIDGPDSPVGLDLPTKPLQLVIESPSDREDVVSVLIWSPEGILANVDPPSDGLTVTQTVFVEGLSATVSVVRTAADGTAGRADVSELSSDDLLESSAWLITLEPSATKVTSITGDELLEYMQRDALLAGHQNVW